LTIAPDVSGAPLVKVFDGTVTVSEAG